MKTISTTDISRVGNDCYIYESVTLTEQFGIYAVINFVKVTGWLKERKYMCYVLPRIVRKQRKFIRNTEVDSMQLFRIRSKGRVSDQEYCSVLATDFMHACKVFSEANPNDVILTVSHAECEAAIFYSSGSYQLVCE